MLNYYCIYLPQVNYPPNLTSLLISISQFHVVFLPRVHETSKSIIRSIIGSKMKKSTYSITRKKKRRNQKKHKTTIIKWPINAYNLDFMVENHQGIVVQSQSLRSALEDGEHHFEISDNIVSGMSASSTVVLFSVYTVSFCERKCFSATSSFRAENNRHSAYIFPCLRMSNFLGWVLECQWKQNKMLNYLMEIESF
jgi:hypothetical protein